MMWILPVAFTLAAISGEMTKSETETLQLQGCPSHLKRTSLGWMDQLDFTFTDNDSESVFNCTLTAPRNLSHHLIVRQPRENPTEAYDFVIVYEGQSCEGSPLAVLDRRSPVAFSTSMKNIFLVFVIDRQPHEARFFIEWFAANHLFGSDQDIIVPNSTVHSSTWNNIEVNIEADERVFIVHRIPVESDRIITITKSQSDLNNIAIRVFKGDKCRTEPMKEVHPLNEIFVSDKGSLILLVYSLEENENDVSIKITYESLEISQKLHECNKLGNWRFEGKIQSPGHPDKPKQWEYCYITLSANGMARLRLTPGPFTYSKHEFIVFYGRTCDTVPLLATDAAKDTWIDFNKDVTVYVNPHSPSLGTQTLVTWSSTNIINLNNPSGFRTPCAQHYNKPNEAILKEFQSVCVLVLTVPENRRAVFIPSETDLERFEFVVFDGGNCGSYSKVTSRYTSLNRKLTIVVSDHQSEPDTWKNLSSKYESVLGDGADRKKP